MQRASDMLCFWIRTAMAALHKNVSYFWYSRTGFIMIIVILPQSHLMKYLEL